MAQWLKGRTGQDGWAMSLDQLLFAVMVEREDERERTLNTAIAARAAQADAKGWKKFVKDFARGDE